MNIILLARLLRHDLREAVLDPGLMIVSGKAIFEELERFHWLDQVHVILSLFLFSELEPGSVQVRDIIDVDHEVLVDAKEHRWAHAIWRDDKISVHEHGLLCQVLQ